MNAESPETELRRHALRILGSALRAVDPVTLVAGGLVDDPELQRWSHEIAAAPPPGPAAREGRMREGRGVTRLVAVGKAALGMTRGALQVLGDTVDEGIVLVPRGGDPERPSWLPPQLRLRFGGHPLPDEGGEEAAREVVEMLRGATSRDRLLVLISGGGSALLGLPRPGLPLEALRETTRILLEAGLPIHEFNGVRRHLEVLKGGGLARAARPSQVLALVLSDVVGDDPSVVASGPLTASGERPREVEIMLRRRGIWDDLPEAARRTLREAGSGDDGPEAPPGSKGGWEPVIRMVGSGGQALEAAAAEARRLGYGVQMLTRTLQGEARRAGRGLARVGIAVRDGVSPPAPPACLLAAGETTVDVTGPGRGGRNQEVALGAALALEGQEGILVASLGTDGVDGPTDAAGATADGTTVARARGVGIRVEDALGRNDAYTLLDRIGDLIRTGPTGTNVADLMVVLVR